MVKKQATTDLRNATKCLHKDYFHKVTSPSKRKDQSIQMRFFFNIESAMLVVLIPPVWLALAND